MCILDVHRYMLLRLDMTAIDPIGLRPIIVQRTPLLICCDHRPPGVCPACFRTQDSLSASIPARQGSYSESI